MTIDLSLWNACCDAGRKLYDAWERMDWDTVRACYAPDLEYEDRRSGLGLSFVGRDQQLEQLRIATEVSRTALHADMAPVAVRGERLAIGLVELSAAGDRAGDYVIEQMGVARIDEEGRTDLQIAFDPSDFDGAYAELNARWFELGATDENRVAVAFLDAINTRDWDRLRSLMTGDFVYVDHRPVSFGSTGPDEYIERAQALSGLGDFKLRIVKDIDVGRPGNAVLVRREGRDEHGNDVMWEYLAVGKVAGDRIDRTEVFPVDRLDDAVAKADELARTSG